jgi:predicted transcriptional regulator of viral defense system
MQRLTEIALEKASQGIFTKAEVACWVGGSPQRQFSLVKRALASGQIVHVRRGLYCLASKYLREKIDPLVLAQRIYGPSYVSLETALSYHGWIPEAVYAITSTALDRSREFRTPLGHFSFTRVPQKTFYTQVTRVEKGASILLAEPLKALADYVYVHKLDWSSSRPVIESLRVDKGVLESVDTQMIDDLLVNYPSPRVRRFLHGLRKDLKR